MLVITGNGWLLRPPGFIAKTSKGIWRCCHHQLTIYQGHHRPWAKPCNKRRAAAGDLAYIRKIKSRYCFSLVLTGIEKSPQKFHNWLHTPHYTAYAIGLCPSCLTWSFPQLCPNVLKKQKENHTEKKKISKISLEIFYQGVRLFLFTKVIHKAAWPRKTTPKLSFGKRMKSDSAPLALSGTFSYTRNFWAPLRWG